MRRHDFRVPVLNRSGRVKINTVVQAPPEGRPLVGLHCVHSGGKIVFQGPSLVFGVDVRTAALTGLVVGVAVVLAVSTTNPSPIAFALITFALGAAGQVVGAGVVRALSGIRRLLG